MREIRVFAPAKLNLYLDVLDKRPDGYHNIETIFEKIDLKDEIIIKEKPKGGIKIKVIPGVCSSGQTNTVYKAAEELCKEKKIKLNLELILKKKIPVSAGLGGGSSDASSTLKALNKIFQLGIPKKRLFEIASTIGKDAPFFMIDKPFAIGRGTGELLETLNIKNRLFHILVKPKISLSTRLMYKRIDKYSCPAKRHSLKETLFSLKKKDINLLERSYYNSFEDVLAEDAIHINRIKAMLSGIGAANSLLSGSGPTVFCTFKDSRSAEKIFKKIPKANSREVFLVSTYR